MATTYDGKPIAEEAPFGAAIVVYRRRGSRLEFLLLHRAHNGPTYEGDWAWTPPAGSRQPGEDPVECAKRELLEETGLELALTLTPHGGEQWLVFVAEASCDVPVVLDEEHDRHEWVECSAAIARCRPATVSSQLGRVWTELSRR
jgi:8-oxo-dGTP pyrophosphatase MutT (NUDIX family)